MAIPGWLQHPRLGALVPWLLGAVAAGIAANKLVGGYADLGIYLDVAREFRAGGVDIFRDRPPAKGAGTWKAVPADLQNLDLLNIPGSVSCMATCLVMLARSGLAGPDGLGDLKPVKSETYVDGKSKIHAVDKVEIDRPA